jgi:hypothetical protein
MSHAVPAERPVGLKFPSGFVALERRWLYLAGACGLWALAFWQLAGPVDHFLSEAARVRMMVPYHIRWVSGLPWWAIAVVGSLAALAAGPRLRPVGNAVLIGLPLVANVVIHLSLHAAQAVAVEGLFRYF